MNLKFDEEPKYEAFMRLFDPLIGPAPQRPILIEGAAKVRGGFQLLCSCFRRLFCLMMKDCSDFCVHKYEAFMRLFDPLIGPAPQRPILIEGAAKVRGGCRLALPLYRSVYLDKEAVLVGLAHPPVRPTHWASAAAIHPDRGRSKGETGVSTALLLYQASILSYE